MNALFRLFCRLTFRPTLAFNDAMCLVGIWRRWVWVDEHVALGCAPRPRDIRRLATEGVTVFINLCAEFCGYVDLLEEMGIEQHWLPTPDYTCPSEEDLRRGLDLLRRHKANGQKTYVHCKAGRTRAAALVLCYVASERAITAEEAYKLLRKQRPQLTRNLHRRSAVRAAADSGE